MAACNNSSHSDDVCFPARAELGTCSASSILPKQPVLAAQMHEDLDWCVYVCVQEMQRRIDAFIPAFQRLVTVVAHNVQYPSDHHQWREDEVQDFKQARYAVAEALEDAAGKSYSSFTSLFVHWSYFSSDKNFCCMSQIGRLQATADCICLYVGWDLILTS